MRRSLLIFLAAVFCVRCASISADSDGFVRYESINRDTVLLRFTSSPAGAEAVSDCEDHKDHITTPDTVRLPIDGLCVVTFVKAGYQDEATEFDPAAYAHGSVFDEPDCGDPGVWCDTGDSLGRIVFSSLLLGTSGLIARAFDPVRHGRGEIGAVLMPLPEDDGSDSAPPGG